TQVGIEEQIDKFPVQLSGGELQRAAIARALVFSPELLLADEPTGNLDNTTSWEIIKLLQDINKLGTTVIMATHNLDVVNNLDKRTVELVKGKVVKDNKKAPEVAVKQKEDDSEKKVQKDESEPVSEEKVTEEEAIETETEKKHSKGDK
ncbi:cell division ATP-binding protein FtsE, partial [Candidatus Woesearchaeota archaeon CG10_big_fil_rev_8_21_14_0_10_45_5]